MGIDKAKLAGMIEHTLLGDNIDEKRLLAHLDEAKELQVFGVCIPLAWVPLAKKYLSNTHIKVITVIDFPHGNKSSAQKAHEAQLAASLGADEIDMVLDYEALRNKNYEKALRDITLVLEAARPIPIKVIVETSALSKEQLVCATTLVALSKAQFIKTSTGFHQAGAQSHDIELMRALLPIDIQIKASGGIRNYAQACSMIQAGASRIGASQSRQILRDILENTHACY
jgi:deoxyribose-phosphate aldolase